jgi:nucleoside-diphosphate-sugar epimerase
MKIVTVTGSRGYIGSVLCPFLRAAGWHVEEIDWRIDPVEPINRDYRRFKPDSGPVVHLAAHSSVAMCDADVEEAAYNNVRDLIPFTLRCSPNHPFVFASTGSLYDPNADRLYDATKRAAEGLLRHLHPKAALLRFGTVCGVSPCMREDVLLNGMVRDAVRNGVVTVRNPDAVRPVLFFPDLCAAVARALDSGSVGVVPLASYETPIRMWAAIVAARVGAEVIDEEPTPHYDFTMPVLKSLTTPYAVIDELAAYWRSVS